MSDSNVIEVNENIKSMVNKNQKHNLENKAKTSHDNSATVKNSNQKSSSKIYTATNTQLQN